MCTDKLGTWPENQQKCFQTFENCQKSIGNTDFEDGDFTDTFPSTIKPIAPSTTEKQPPKTTSKAPPIVTTTKVTTTTEVSSFKIFLGQNLSKIYTSKSDLTTISPAI